ncbi:phage baseplate assembly protein V [Lentzea sp. NEAU-D7]|uniref:phage baseplate assembly protein V n=1 Tax=Lentzea sp. NEAU-D7 TaxID=2994667 RepID=UPI00224A8144|nr:phage baseplate assembly protein V [Lentzea sp. NEAU-D7]MCX2954576.1 phage baseplate assembly protein V [Lentzea sp. NEAU-D7]
MTSTLMGLNNTVRASVRVGWPVRLPLLPAVERNLVRAVVDMHRHLPDMFELTFVDPLGDILESARMEIGTRIAVYGGAPTSSMAEMLIDGEITSIEAECVETTVYTIVRGYEKGHRLQRVVRTRTFMNMKDSDIVRRIALESGLRLGDIDETRTAHVHVAQVAQTDWDFLKQRAAEIGFEVGISLGELFFRGPSSSKSRRRGRRAGKKPAAKSESAKGKSSSKGGKSGLGGPAAGLGGLAAGLLGTAELTFGVNLLSFRPRVTAGNLTPSVEVRVWNPDTGNVAVGRADAASGSADLAEHDPAELGEVFTKRGLGGLRRLGPPTPGLKVYPSVDSRAHVVVNRPVARGAAARLAADEVAAGIAEHVGSTYAEAEGFAIGDPLIRPGEPVAISGVPAYFEGEWTITQARHVFAEAESGYRTRFVVSGRNDRSLLGLASVGATQPKPPSLPGLVCAIVSNIADPEDQGRVKLMLPWLDPSFETDWARVAQFFAGARAGSVFLPEVGDEVLVGFEHGDVRRPYVLGGLLNEASGFDLGGEPVRTVGAAGSVIHRGIVSSSGNKLVFHDEMPPAGSTATASDIVLGTGGDTMQLAIDQTAGTVTLLCDPGKPESKAPAGTIDIQCGNKGQINITVGPNGEVTIDGGARLNLSASAAIVIESGGTLELSGKTVTVKGNPIKLN